MDRMTELYLREDVYFEPLFNQWFAWPYLIPPVTAARHMVNTHRRIMSSFVNNYKLHMMAVNEPGMAGAEFLNANEEQVTDIKRLIEVIAASSGVARVERRGSLRAGSAFSGPPSVSASCRFLVLAVRISKADSRSSSLS